MSTLPNGKYRTKDGSYLTVSGKHSGIFRVDFDWFEELNACSECECNTQPMHDGDRWLLTWECEECGGGFAELFPVEDEE